MATLIWFPCSPAKAACGASRSPQLPATQLLFETPMRASTFTCAPVPRDNGLIKRGHQQQQQALPRPNPHVCVAKPDPCFKYPLEKVMIINSGSCGCYLEQGMRRLDVSSLPPGFLSGVISMQLARMSGVTSKIPQHISSSTNDISMFVKISTLSCKLSE
jgi:hypothetical protein